MSARSLVALLLAAGCYQPTTGQPPPPAPPPPVPPDAWYAPVDGSSPGGPGGAYCEQDSECVTGTVCAHDFTCHPPGDLYTGHAEWTVEGQPASEALCASSPSLVVGFEDGYGYGTGGYAPVPCVEGKFTLTKLPRSFTSFYVAIDNGEGGDDPVFGAIDPQTGIGLVDLPY